MSADVHSMVVEHDTLGARKLRAASCVDAGFVAAAVAPDLRRRFELGWALLEALGKRPDVSGAGRHDSLNWETLNAWLPAHGITDIAVLDAQWLPLGIVADIVGLAATADVRIWLIAHRPVPEAYEEAVAAWPLITPGDTAQLAAVVRAASAHPEPPALPTFPGVPSDNWPTFRHAARQALIDDDFAVVDAAFRLAYKRTADWLAATPEVTEDNAVAALRSQLSACITVPEMVTTIRAAQVAMHRAGWNVQADLTRMLATAEETARAAMTSPATWQRMRAYREPYRGAAAALTAAGLAVGEMLPLRCDDVSADGTTVAGKSVPAPAAVYLRAQLLHRRLMGADVSEPLFADDNGTPGTARSLTPCAVPPPSSASRSARSPPAEPMSPTRHGGGSGGACPSRS